MHVHAHVERYNTKRRWHARHPRKTVWFGRNDRVWIDAVRALQVSLHVHRHESVREHPLSGFVHVLGHDANRRV